MNQESMNKDETPSWLTASQELPFPDWMPRDVRAKIRATLVALPASDDDDEESGLVVIPPSSDLNMSFCVTSLRIAKAFKRVIGDSCGTPPVENIEKLEEFLTEDRGF